MIGCCPQKNIPLAILILQVDFLATVPASLNVQYSEFSIDKRTSIEYYSEFVSMFNQGSFNV